MSVFSAYGLYSHFNLICLDAGICLKFDLRKLCLGYFSLEHSAPRDDQIILVLRIAWLRSPYISFCVHAIYWIDFPVIWYNCLPNSLETSPGWYWRFCRFQHRVILEIHTTKTFVMQLTVTEDCKFEPYIQSREYYLPNLQVNEDSSIVGNVASLTHVLVGLRGGWRAIAWYQNQFF